MCFAQADGQKNLERDPVHQRMNNRDAGQKCKAVANRLRKIQTAPGERNPSTLPPARAKQRSNASFETKHRPLAAFPGSLSFTQRRVMNLTLREKSRRSLLIFPGRCAFGAKKMTTCSPSSLVSIGLEVDSRHFRCAQIKKSGAFEGSSDSARRFHVRCALGR